MLTQGYHSKTEILTREQFYEKKRAIEEAKLNLNKDKTKSLASTVPNRKRDPFLDLLAEREEWVLNGRWLTIIFLRVENPEKKTEISGYIDYAHRLKTEDFRPIFDGSVKLVPKPTDLSYYNWKTGVCASNDSPNFKVDASSGESGLLFRNKRDRKVINVNPYIKQDDNVKRTEVISNDYTQIVLYDHETRKKNN